MKNVYKFLLTTIMALCFTLYGVAQAPVANAGTDKTICKDQTSYTLSEASASGYTTITWTTSGSGSWGSPTTAGNENSTYYPAAGDKTAGFVNLTITAVKTGWVTPTTDFMVLNFANEPTANAGSNATICETGTYTVNDATAGNYSSVSWTTGGDGTFTGGTTLTPTYTPGTNDKAGVSVTLTLHAAANSPCLTEATDNMVLTLQNPPDAAAGSDATICNTSNSYTLAATASGYSTITWTTSGTGTWGSPSTSGNEDATYYPSTADKTAGTVTLTITLVPNSPCVGNDTDDMTLSIQSPPTADAGSDATICETDVPYTLAATATNSNAVSWSTSGTGTWGGTQNIEDATYYPSATDINNGSVTLTLLATHAVCSNDDDAMTLTFKKTPSASAGNDATICETAIPYTLAATASNYTTITWTSSGTGTFTNNAVEDAVYNPSEADKTAGSVTLTMTLVNSPCSIDDDDMTLNFQANPTVEAGVNATICEDETYTLADATVTTGLYTAVTWTTSGDGDFDDDSALNPEYTPGETDADQQGGITLTLSAVPLTPCVVAITDDMNLFVGQAPEVDAGDDQTICETGTSLDGTVDHELSTLWTTFGDGTFANANMEDTYYYPGSDDIDDGLVKLALVASPNIPCELMYSDDMYLYITQELPTVLAGSDDTGCSNEAYNFVGATASDYENVLWVKLNADGTFVDPNIVNATYNFGPNDIINGFAVVKLVAQPITPCLQLVEDEITLYVQNAAVANVGPDKTICEDATYTFTSPYPPVSGTDVWASYVEYVSWSTSGSGTFTYPDTYCKPTGGELVGTDGFTYFKLGEIENSTGHASNGYGKYMNLSTGLLADSSYTVTWRCGYLAGATASLWIDLNMNGTFEPSERLLTNASITTSNTSHNFTVPSGATPGEKRLRIRMRYQVAGGNSSDPCANFQYGETEDYTVFIVGANGNVVPPTYDPSASDVTAGSVNLTMTGRPISPCTINATDFMVLNFQLLPVADAGDDAATICETDTYTLSDATAANYSSLTWTTSGTGSFTGDPVNPTYNPSAGDITTGSATLTLTLQPISPCTATDDDSIDLTIQLKPTVDAGTNTTVCEDITSVTLDGTVGGGPYDGLEWTHDGDGTINDASAEDTYYTPAATDAGQTVEFTLTATSSSPCSGDISDSFTVEFQELPEVSVGSGADASYCEDVTAIPLNSSITGGPHSSVLWSTTNGGGTFADATAESTTYAAVAADGDKNLAFKLTVTPTSPCSTTVDDEFSVYIQKLPVADAGEDATICENGSYTLSDATATDYTTVTWMTTLGANGSFDDESALNPTYTPGSLDIANGSVVLQMLVGPVSPCTIGDDDEMTLFIQKLPVANAGSDGTICADGTYPITDATASYQSSVSWSGGTGSFDNSAILLPTYTPGVGETGPVTLTLTAAPVSPCLTSDDDDMLLTVNPLPELTDVDLQATKTSPINWFDASGDLDEGYQLCIDGLSATNYNLDIDGLTVSEDLEPDVYNEFFQTSTVPADFFTWWAAKGVTAGATPGTWQAAMWKIIIGEKPIFYLLLDDAKAPVGDYKLIDGLQKQYASTDAPLTLPGDYPQGNYTFTGTVEDINGCVSEDVTIAIEFVHAPVANAGSDATIANNQSYTVDDATAEHYTSITWSHDGDGTLTDGSGLTPTYDAAASDGGSTVTLTMYVDGNAPCVQVWDEMDITVDFAPVVVITYPANNTKLYSKDDITVTGTASDNDGTVQSVELNINNGGWNPANGTVTWDNAGTALNLGKNTIAARATDDDGYVSDVVTHDVYVHVQDIPLTSGWQLISSFLDPIAPTPVPTIMSGVVANLVTMNTIPSGIYAPAPFNVNTIGNWNIQKGYKVKMNANTTLTIGGDPLDDNNQNLAGGFYYMPVLTDQITDITDIMDPLGNIYYVQDLAGNIYWPGGLLTAWTTLLPGRAYYASFTGAINIDFPDYQGYLVDEALQPVEYPAGPWNLTRSANTHIISVEQKAIAEFEDGFIGAFDASGACIGFVEIGQVDGNIGLMIFGDDEWTDAKDGAAEGEAISFRYYNNADKSETALTAEFDITKPQYDGKFTTCGLSMIKSFFKASTGVGEITTSSIQVYPNPATDAVTIGFAGHATVSDVIITTAEGTAVRSLTLKGAISTFDISDLAPGVYFLQFNTTNGTSFTKLVVQ